MKTATACISIDRSPEAVFDFMLDFANAAKWRWLISEMELVDGGSPRAGSKVRLRFWAEGKADEQIATLAVVDRPNRYVMVNDSRGFLLTVDNVLTAEGSGTRVCVTMDTKGNSLGAKLLLPLLLRAHRRRLVSTLKKLKQVVEGG